MKSEKKSINKKKPTKIKHLKTLGKAAKTHKLDHANKILDRRKNKEKKT